MADVLTVFQSEFWNKTEPVRARIISTWTEAAGRHSLIAEGFRETGGRQWVNQLVAHWGLHERKVKDVAATVSISDGQASRLLNHGSASIGVLALLASQQSKALPKPDTIRFACAGLGFVLPLCTWLDQTRSSRPLKTAIAGSLDTSDVCLLLALERESLHLEWHELTVRYEDNLFPAADAHFFQRFLQKLTKSYLTVTASLPETGYQRANYFPDGTASRASRWILCRDLNSLWAKYHQVWPCAWEVTSALSAWLCNQEPQDEDEAA